MSRIFTAVLALLTVAVSTNADTLTIKTDSLDNWSIYSIGSTWDVANASALLGNAAAWSGTPKIRTDHWTDGKVPNGYDVSQKFGLAADGASGGYYAYTYSLESLLPASVSDVSFTSGWVSADDHLKGIMLRSADGTVETLWNGTAANCGWGEYVTGFESELSSLADLIFVVSENGGGSTLTLLGATLNYTAVAGGNGDNAVPEPATLALFGLGIAGLVAARRRKK